MSDQLYDIIELPSGGLFYQNGCNKVKVYHITMGDEQLLSSANLMQSGLMLDELFKRKVHPVSENDPFVPPSKMLIGDRFALAIFLRVTMEPYYDLRLLDENGKSFIAKFDLTQLKTKDITEIADPITKEFEFRLPKSQKLVTFRLMNGEDELELTKERQKYNNDSLLNNVLKFERMIMSIDGNRDKGEISRVIKSVNITDGWALVNYMDKVTPSFDFNIQVPSPSGKIIDTKLTIGADFFFPTTN